MVACMRNGNDHYRRLGCGGRASQGGARRQRPHRRRRPARLAAPAGLERLRQAFGEAKALIGRADHHVVTMTGELADTFASRPDGVERLAALAAAS